VIDMARFPTLQSTIERRLLVTYRADPEVVAALLPEPFRPQIVRGFAVVGICAIRIAHTRTRGIPAALGFRSENAAHRIAVEWTDADGQPRTGVYIPRRDTNSRLNTVAGGRLFSGELGHAHFEVTESITSVAIQLNSDDGEIQLKVSATIADGYAPRLGGFSGTELHTNAWQVEPAAIVQAHSSFFDDTNRFPPGLIELDSALVMRDIPVKWRNAPALRATQEPRKELARKGA
jgi:hypothetical protein